MSSTDSAPDAGSPSKSVFARLAVPHSFNPDMGPVEALLAVVGTLVRIFGACILFALWGGFSAWAWSAIGSHFWRMAAAAPLVLVFPAALAAFMMTVTAVGRRIGPGR